MSATWFCVWIGPLRAEKLVSRSNELFLGIFQFSSLRSVFSKEAIFSFAPDLSRPLRFSSRILGSDFSDHLKY